MTRAVLAILLLLALAAACAGGSADLDVTPPAQSTAKATETVLPDGSRVIEAAPLSTRQQPAGGQQLRLAGGAFEPATLDPALLRDSDASFLARQLFRGLVRLDDDLDVQPELADRITVSADGLVYEFRLRSGLSFQNGAALDVQAVIQSFERATDPGLTGGDGSSLPAGAYLDDIAGVAERLAGEADAISGLTAVDATTLRVTLVRPAANFLLKLAGPPAWIVDSSTAIEEDWWRSPNGSGPFGVAEFQQGRLLILEPFEDFYAGRPFLNEVSLTFGANAAQPFNLYERGDLDLTELPGYAIDRALSGTDYLGDDLRIVPQLATTFIALSPTAEPWAAQQLRAALGLLVDRDRIVEVGLAGRATQADGLVPNGILGRAWPAQLPAYDPAAARTRLDGMPALESAPQLFDPGGGSAVLLSEVAERELQLTVDVIAPLWPEFVDALAARALPAYALTWIADYPDPASFLTTLFASSSSDNYLNYANSEVDALLAAAAVEQDVEQRATLYLQAQQIIIDDGVLIPLYHGVTYMVVQPEVQGLVITPIGILALDNVWIAS